MTEPKKDEPAKPAEAPKPAVAAAPAPAAAAAPAPAPAAVAPPPKPLSPAEQKRQALVAKEKELGEKLVARLGSGKLEVAREQHAVTVDLAKAREALVLCRKELGYRVLADVTAVDYLKQDAHPERYCVVWNLLSVEANARLRVRAYVSEDDPRAPSVADLWPAANWGERECYDMFGIRFDGHPDLRRILMPEDFGSYPLRKDYPLRGRGERDNFPVLTRSSTSEARQP